MGMAERIVHNDLNLRKIGARWIPNLKTDQQKKKIVRCSKDLLKVYEPDGTKCLCDVITGDEIWLHFYCIPNNKQADQMPVAADEERPVKLQSGFKSWT